MRLVNSISLHVKSKLGFAKLFRGSVVPTETEITTTVEKQYCRNECNTIKQSNTYKMFFAAVFLLSISSLILYILLLRLLLHCWQNFFTICVTLGELEEHQCERAHEVEWTSFNNYII